MPKETAQDVMDANRRAFGIGTGKKKKKKGFSLSDIIAAKMQQFGIQGKDADLYDSSGNAYRNSRSRKKFVDSVVKARGK